MYKIIKDGDSVRVKLEDDLTSTTNTSFASEIVALIKKDSPKELILDLDVVEIVDSFGIRGFYTLIDVINTANGKLKAINVSNHIYDLFTHMRLDTRFEIIKKSE